MKKQNLKYYLAGAVALLTFIVYLASLRNDFVEWDDSQYVFENLHIRSLDLSFFKWAFFDFYAANWHPLTWISHALDYAVWGLNPLGHHLTNNILHAANTFVVILLVVRLVEAGNAWGGQAQEPPLQFSSRFTSHVSRFTLIAAGVTGLLFGLHPIHVESVAWVAERKDLLCAFFYLLSLMSYLRYAKAVSGSRFTINNSRHFLFSLVFFILALLSKPMAVSLPIVLIILDWYPFKRINSFKTFRTAVIEKIPFIALSLISSILTLLAQHAGEAITAMRAMPLSTRMLVAAKSLIAYLWKMLVPINLIPYYPYPNDVSFFSLEYLAAIILCAAITTAGIFMAKRRKLLLSVWSYYLATLIPVLGIVQVGGQSMADRYTYLSGIGPFFITGLLSAWITEKTQEWTLFSKYARNAIAVLLLVSVTFLTFRQIEIWKNSFYLWTYVIEKEPDRVPLAYTNRGLAFYSKGQIEPAIEDFNKAISLDPASYKAYLNRGAAFVNKGQLSQAATDFDKAIALNPSYYQAYNARGALFGMSGYPEKAIEQFSKAIEINPDYSAAYGNRGAAYSLIGQHDKALGDVDKAIVLDRYYADNYLARGNIYLAGGNPKRAISDFKSACNLGSQSGCDLLKSLHITETDQAR